MYLETKTQDPELTLTFKCVARETKTNHCRVDDFGDYVGPNEAKSQFAGEEAQGDLTSGMPNCLASVVTWAASAMLAVHSIQSRALSRAALVVLQVLLQWRV